MAKRDLTGDLVVLFVIVLLISPILGRASLYLIFSYALLSFIIIYLLSKNTIKALFVSFSEMLIAIMFIPMITTLEQYFIQAILYQKKIEFFRALYYTVVASFFSALLGVSLAVPFGYAYTRNLIPFREGIRSFIEVPMMLPHTVAGILLLSVFSRSGIWGISITDTLLGIVIAMFFISAPIAVNQMIEAFNHVPERYEYVSRSLGAPPFKTFVHVLLPMVKNDVLTAFISSFMRSMSEFGAIIVITTYPPVISLYTFRELSLNGISSALAVSTLSILILVPIIILIKAYLRRKPHGTSHS